MKTVSIRLDKVKEIEFFGRLLKEKKSELVRDLLKEGRKMKALNLYKQKKISLGLAAKLADLDLGEFLDLMEEHNVHLNITLEDAKQAMQYAEELL